jgi:hypothetical protein
MQIPANDRIANAIVTVRNQRVVLDSDIAALYGVPTKVLVQAVRRNIERFPDDFRFQVTETEWESLRSQIVTSKNGRGGRRYPPTCFTEQGVAMLSSVLKSANAIAINVEIVRTFVRLRQMASIHAELARLFAALEQRVETRMNAQDEAIADFMRAIRHLIERREPSRRPIGFVAEEPHPPSSLATPASLTSPAAG